MALMYNFQLKKYNDVEIVLVFVAVFCEIPFTKSSKSAFIEASAVMLLLSLN